MTGRYVLLFPYPVLYQSEKFSIMILMTLTQVASFSRKFVVFFIAISSLAAAGYIGTIIYRAYNPSPKIVVYEEADRKFGLLPVPKFPLSVDSAKFTYSIDTIDGNLPTFDRLVKVYIIPPPFASFLSPDRAISLAQSLNLIPIPQIISETEYKFTNTDSSLLVSLDSGNFHYSRASTASAAISIKDPSLENDFKKFLEKLGLLNDNLKSGRAVIEDQKDYTQISIWPNDIDGKKIYTASDKIALVNAVVDGSIKDFTSFMAINFTFWPIDTTSYATYQLKDANDALTDLKSGQGIIIQAPDNSRASITNVYLGYYQSIEYSPYLQPIIVFEGKDFLAYVPAITKDNYDTTSR